jgi:PAS domain S-box-containing protein
MSAHRHAACGEDLLPDRMLVLVPDAVGGALVREMLTGAGLKNVAASAADIVDAINRSMLAAAVIAEEALADFDWPALKAALANQPPWSDCPFLVLASIGVERPTYPMPIEALGNLTLIDRPLREEPLVSAARAALRGRERQRRAEAYLHEREAAEEQVRLLATTLEARVAARTSELHAVHAESEATKQILHESAELYRHTIELSSFHPWTATPDGMIVTFHTRWRDAAVHSAVRSAREVLRMAHPEDRALLMRTWRDTLRNRTANHVEVRGLVPNGSYRWVHARAAPRLDADGEVVRWYGTVEDIDDRKQADFNLRQIQRELIHVSRLSAMGAMASALAHELNQPLTAIANYVRGGRRMISQIETPDKAAEAALLRDALDEADDNAVRAGDIIRHLRELVIHKDGRRELSRLPKLIDNAARIALIDAPGLGIRVHYDLNPAALDVRVDRVQIEQVLINLLRNAVEAVQQSEERRLWVSTSIVSDDWCKVCVADSGPGLDPAIAERLFAPFNTSKSEGMGIGLSICRTIIEAHGGQIWAERVRDHRTHLCFTLKRSSADQSASPDANSTSRRTSRARADPAPSRSARSTI